MGPDLHHVTFDLSSFQWASYSSQFQEFLRHVLNIYSTRSIFDLSRFKCLILSGRAVVTNAVRRLDLLNKNFSNVWDQPLTPHGGGSTSADRASTVSTEGSHVLEYCGWLSGSRRWRNYHVMFIRTGTDCWMTALHQPNTHTLSFELVPQW